MPQCSSCGAIVTFVPPEVASECDFCGAKIVAQPKSADPTVAPEGVLPFHITQPQASAHVKQWISSRWFAPNALKRFATPEAIDGGPIALLQDGDLIRADIPGGTLDVVGWGNQERSVDEVTAELARRKSLPSQLSAQCSQN